MLGVAGRPSSSVRRKKGGFGYTPNTSASAQFSGKTGERDDEERGVSKCSADAPPYRSGCAHSQQIPGKLGNRGTVTGGRGKWLRVCPLEAKDMAQHNCAGITWYDLRCRCDSNRSSELVAIGDAAVIFRRND